jgi:hypothetical protein
MSIQYWLLALLIIVFVVGMGFFFKSMNLHAVDKGFRCITIFMTCMLVVLIISVAGSICSNFAACQ